MRCCARWKLLRSLELVIRPCAWVMVLVHAPDPISGLPFPIGYITANTNVVERYERLLAELVAGSPNSSAILWTSTGETAVRALALTDLALSIQAE